MNTSSKSFLVALAASLPVGSYAKVDFTREVRPILSETCFQCHGPDKKKRKAKLRLDLPEGAAADIDAGRADAVSWGRNFISNPDLPTRFQLGAEIAPNVNVPHSWYGQGPEGYIDYPTLTEPERIAAG